jgi:glutathione S-transferase
MSLTLFAHPFSSYCQKVLTALYENATPFTWAVLDHQDPEVMAEFERRWPLKRMPLLVDDDRAVAEATIIIEHLAVHHPGPVRLIPDDADAALEVRFVDRFFDNYVQTPQQKMVFDALRDAPQRDPKGVADARAALETAYAWLEQRMAGRTWAVGDAFSLADCSAAPALFYADWTHPIGDAFPHVIAYRERLKARPSFARAVDEARPFRPFFPLGAPDRD